MRTALQGFGVCTCAVAIVVFCGGCPTSTGNEPATNTNDNVAAAGDATVGAQLFAATRTTEGGAELACAGCHADDGSGNIGPDIRGSGADHLQEHSQGTGPHPEGVKFAQLTAANYADVSAYLVEQCNADPNCVPGEDDDDDHSDGGGAP